MQEQDQGVRQPTRDPDAMDTEGFVKGLMEAYARLLEGQRPLDPEISAILHANMHKLYKD